MEIKKITEDNLDEVIELIYTTSLLFNVSTMITDGPKGKKLFKLLFEECFDDMELFGYFDSSKLLGVIGIEDNNYIPVLYVLKEYHHLNIGTKLIEFIKEYIKEKTDVLEVCAHYKAIPFYQKNGFELVNEIIDEKVMMSCSIMKEKKNLK